jgi:copper chaperone CopZ
MAQTIQLNVKGMTCDHCVHAVTNAAQEVEGVTSAKVSLKDKSAVLEGDGIDVDKVIAAIREEGYEAALA